MPANHSITNVLSPKWATHVAWAPSESYIYCMFKSKTHIIFIFWLNQIKTNRTFISDIFKYKFYHRSSVSQLNKDDINILSSILTFNCAQSCPTFSQTIYCINRDHHITIQLTVEYLFNYIINVWLISISQSNRM